MVLTTVELVSGLCGADHSGADHSGADHSGAGGAVSSSMAKEVPVVPLCPMPHLD